ncbi:NF041680 family putative transposase [Streptosporangium sp. NPDC087985]|uniref:NF041680 family putative transposase n=1 Tax=Streptosporangium sp. NPDC087985 TaxID=3366196 RepID=UPI0037FF9A94
MTVITSVLSPDSSRQEPANLAAFRQELMGCFTRRSDALFELADAVLAAGPVVSLPHLSLDPLHRRGHGSVYAALAQGRINTGALRDLLATRLHQQPAVFAIDVSCWARSDAECSPGRGFYYHPSKHSAGKPIIAGWAFSWLAALELTTNSWTAPLDVMRLVPGTNVNDVAARQILQLLPRLPDSGGRLPLFVLDGGYDPVRLILGLPAAPVQLLVRIRSDRCFYAAPPPTEPGARGRPRRHGAKFACTDPTTWPPPSATLTTTDAQYGTVTVHAWSGLHAKTQQHDGHGSRGPRPIVPGTVVRLTVTALPGRTRKPKTLWLWWHGLAGCPLDLNLLWRSYVRRFDLEHTFRFCKQTLNWTLPRPRTPEQADRWTWLVIAAYTQLHLARTLVTDLRLPWEKPLPTHRLTPGRVRRRFRSIHAVVGTPASAPQPCGYSPGRPPGTIRGPAPRHPAIKTTSQAA